MIVDSLNATIRFGDRWVLKFFRRLEEGVSPEIWRWGASSARAPANWYRAWPAISNTAAPERADHPGGASSTSSKTKHHVDARTRRACAATTSAALTKDARSPCRLRPRDRFGNRPSRIRRSRSRSSLRLQRRGALLGKRDRGVASRTGCGAEDSALRAELSSFDRRSVYQVYATSPGT